MCGPGVYTYKTDIHKAEMTINGEHCVLDTGSKIDVHVEAKPKDPNLQFIYAESQISFEINSPPS